MYCQDRAIRAGQVGKCQPGTGQVWTSWGKAQVKLDPNFFGPKQFFLLIISLNQTFFSTQNFSDPKKWILTKINLLTHRINTSTWESS